MVDVFVRVENMQRVALQPSLVAGIKSNKTVIEENSQPKFVFEIKYFN